MRRAWEGSRDLAGPAPGAVGPIEEAQRPRRGRRGHRLAAAVSSSSCAALLFSGSPAAAQDRTGDNAVTQADDAFGSTVGRETIGIYGPGGIRGFSPIAAGNLRLDGLYFDPQTPPALGLPIPSPIVDRTVVKVGLTAQGYPFSAPSGVVDVRLREPATKPGASLLVSGDGWGSYGAEVDGTVVLARDLAASYGVGQDRTAFPDGTSGRSHSASLLLRWRPDAHVEVEPFLTLYQDYDDEADTLYVPAQERTPPLPAARRFDGPAWARFRSNGGNEGLFASWAPSSDWLVRVGAFRSANDQIAAYVNLLEDEDSQGRGERVIVAYPPGESVSLSGEARVVHRIEEGARSHSLVLSVRGRSSDTRYGGGAVVDLGGGSIGRSVEAPRPDFVFGPTDLDRVRQVSAGIAYDGVWSHVGELGLSVASTSYRKDTSGGGAQPVGTESNPVLVSATVAAFLSDRATVYAGYSRGLEQNGRAPATAANRSAPLPTVLTSQRDAGLRLQLSAGLRLLAGVFELDRPHFGFDDADVYRQVGVSRYRGAEFSLSGKVTGRLDVAVAGDFLRVRVDADSNAPAAGLAAVGVPGHLLNANVDWRVPKVAGLSLDAVVVHRSGVPATEDGVVVLPPRARVDLGGRYAFRIAGRKANLRLQVANVAASRGFTAVAPGIFYPDPGRSLLGYLAIDV